MPEKSKDKDLPGTVQRSPAKARRTYRKAHDNAVDSYGEGERAHRTALSALKHSFEKKSDHWEPKKQKGPRSRRAHPTRRRRSAVPPPASPRARPTGVSTPSATPSRSCTSGPGSSGSRAVPT
jgi:cation transport regulator ChaB